MATNLREGLKEIVMRRVSILPPHRILQMEYIAIIRGNQRQELYLASVYSCYDQVANLHNMEMPKGYMECSLIVHKFEQKAGRKIDFDKKESTRFNKKKVRCYKCLQRGHFARECRAKGGNDKQRYSSFKIQEIRKKKNDSKPLINVDTLVDWTEHDGQIVMRGACLEKFAFSHGCQLLKLCLHALSGRYTPLSITIDLDDSDKSSEVNTNDFASSDSSVKSSEPKLNDSTSCASTSSVSTSESEAEN
ncbi:ribonuclease H-like domain-containing protein [Tanacetum coccineum]